MTIGVLALQGDFHEHLESLQHYDVEGVQVRNKSDLAQVDALIMPGGESTTMSKLLLSTGLDKDIIRRAKGGMPIWGTCAGVILLAKNQLGLLDIAVERNSYGRQIDSFKADLSLNRGEIKAFFIRAPKITKLGRWEQVIIEYKGDPVMIQRKNILASTFHSELKYPNLVLEYFLKMI